MACPLGSPLSVNNWVCGQEECDINGDFCCGSSIIPRSKRSNEFQSFVELIESIIALGTQKFLRTRDNIVSVAKYLNPNEKSITDSDLLLSLNRARSMRLFDYDKVTLQYTVNAHNAATIVNLYPYLPFIQEFSPFKNSFPPLQSVIVDF